MGSSRALSAVIPRPGAVSLGGYTLHDAVVGEWGGPTVCKGETRPAAHRVHLGDEVDLDGRGRDRRRRSGMHSACMGGA